MKVLIIAAMDKEINLLINLLQTPKEITLSGVTIWTGEIASHNVNISKCGIGKVNSSLNTLKLINIIKPDLIINTGVAGGAAAPIGSVLVADKVAYHDVWCGPGTIYGQADGIPLFMIPSSEVLEITKKERLNTGLICSGDKFISSEEEIDFIKAKFPEVKAVDMESASIAQTCLMCEIPFAIIRVVSDTPGQGENLSQYRDFWDTAPQKNFSVLTQILKELK